MGAFIAAALALFTGASSFVQTLLVGGSLLLGSNALTALIVGIKAYNAGYQSATEEMQATVARQQKAHREWLDRIGVLSGALSDDDGNAEKTDDEIQRKIEGQMGRAGDVTKPFSPSFLRDLYSIR